MLANVFSAESIRIRQHIDVLDGMRLADTDTLSIRHMRHSTRCRWCRLLQYSIATRSMAWMLDWVSDAIRISVRGAFRHRSWIRHVFVLFRFGLLSWWIHFKKLPTCTLLWPHNTHSIDWAFLLREWDECSAVSVCAFQLPYIASTEILKSRPKIQ